MERQAQQERRRHHKLGKAQEQTVSYSIASMQAKSLKLLSSRHAQVHDDHQEQDGSWKKTRYVPPSVTHLLHPESEPQYALHAALVVHHSLRARVEYASTILRAQCDLNFTRFQLVLLRATSSNPRDSRASNSAATAARGKQEGRAKVT